MKLKITVLFIAFVSSLTIAQTKVGTIDSDYILGLMPKIKNAVKITKNYSKKLDSTFSIRFTDFKVKLEDYKLKEKDMGALEKKAIQKELADLQQDIKKYQKNANTLMELKRDELMRPLYTMLNEAISVVAKANGYTQILTISGNQFAYIDGAFDITSLVIIELGITVPKPTE
jgi:outer membrane protein